VTRPAMRIASARARSLASRLRAVGVAVGVGTFIGGIDSRSITAYFGAAFNNNTEMIMTNIKNWKRWSVVLASAVASHLAACAVPGDDGSAGTELGGADPAASQPQGDPDAFVAPPAPDGAAPAPVDQDKQAGALFAVAPSISPATAIEDAVPGGTYSCPSGNFCAGVWNPAINKWRVFKLFNCRTYTVSNWIGNGFYLDNQTGHPATKLFGQNGAELVPPGDIFPGGGQKNINWTPVFSIKNC
jgi:hypothetical protein